MYIKFLIGSIIFAGICFGIGYRVCYLRMKKRLHEAEEVAMMYVSNYDDLLRAYNDDGR